MQYNNSSSGDPRSFMCYHNEYYINGTEITLKDDYINNHTFNGRKLWKYAKFDHQVTYNNQISYFFCARKTDWTDFRAAGVDRNAERDYARYFILTAWELEIAIEDVTRPIKLSKEETEAMHNAIIEMIEHPKRDWDYPELRILWLVYIVVMVGSLIFREFYIPWLLATCIFSKIRKDVMSS